MKRRVVPWIVVAVLAVVAAGGWWLHQREQRLLAAEQDKHLASAMVRPHSPVMGPENARVTIVEFFDPACEACRAFYPYVKQILAAFPRDVRLVLRYTPFHRHPSIEGVRILEAARQQNRFEPVLTALMDSQPVWASHTNPAADRAWEFAQAAGLDVERARAYVATGTIDKVLEQDVADLKAVGVRATPSFFVNGQPLAEPNPRLLYQMVRTAVESTAGSQ